MPRRKVPIQDQFPYHLSGRCINKEWFSLPMDVVWSVFEEQSNFLRASHNFEIHSLVLMNNHYHMIARTPEANLSDGMRQFTQSISLSLNKLTGRINQLWGSRFFRSMINNPIYYLHAYKYVYCNPLKAKLVRRVEDYPYSSLRGLLGQQKIFVPAIDNTLFDMGAEECLKWLNKLPNDQDWRSVELALQKPVFKLPVDRAKKKASALETRML